MAIERALLKRDPERVKKAVKLVGGRLVATEHVRIVLPAGMTEGELGSITDKIRAVGYHCIITDDNYFAVDSVCAILTFESDGYVVENIDDMDYIVMEFEKDDIIMPVTDLVVTRVLCAAIFAYFESRGRQPFYFNIADRSRIFDTAKLHAGMNLEADRAIIELMTSSSLRTVEDVRKQKRYALKTQSDFDNDDFVVIPQRSVSLGVSDAVGKLTGSYPREGATGALAAPTEIAENLDTLLTS